MAYCTVQDLIDRFGEEELIQLTDRQGSGIIDDALVSRAILLAESEVDGLIGVRYTLPLASVPPLLMLHACDMARYHLYDDRAPEQVETRYQDALQYLQWIVDGKATLGSSANAESKATESISIVIT